ncbi:MAG: UDP-glucose 4-epimerase GalE [Bacteroidales bacterium]|nr:UDP-glucose 4-epimerase GalE [Bacteroidales bacterium]MBR4392184.1 UDP-glucose 4-epimerase GalE [Bacteroidales bacterium]
MKILVTGGTGYIGSHTVVELQNAGFDVVIVDALFNSQKEVVDHIAAITGKVPEFEAFDLTDNKKTADFFKRHSDLTGVIHFAAHKAVGESVQHPIKYYRNNLVSLMNILEEMNTHGIQHLVFSSSCTVYGQADRLPVSESAPIKKAESPYGNTKQIAEEIITDTVHVSKLNAIALRYFNPIGAHESGLIGELPNGVPDNLLPYITQTAYGIREQLKVFGDDYNTPDGTPIRDYIHVVDLAKAHVKAIQRMVQGQMKQAFEVFNLGTGNGYSVLEVIKAFEKATGIKINYKIVGRREGDIEQIWADPSYSNRELGWKAERSLDEMVASAWKWEQHYRQ